MNPKINFTIGKIQDLDRSLLPRIAKLHIQVMKGLLTDLGYPFAHRYFEAVLADPKVLGFRAMSDTGELLGYIIGTPEPSALTSQLTKPFGWFIKQALKVLFSRPRVFFQMIASGLAIKGQMTDEADAIEFVYIGVDPKTRGMGVGRALQQTLMKASKDADYKRILLSIETWNDASIQLTITDGFKIKKTFREGGYHRHRMELML